MLCLLSVTASAQNERFKALFLYNFTRYLEWPSSVQQGDFVILVIGNKDKMTGELQLLASKKKVGSRSIQVREMRDAGGVSQSHMVYVPKSEKSMLASVVAAAGGQPVVVVSDADGAIAKGASFNFTESGGKTQFEVSPSTLERHKIKVSSSLLSLGVVK